VIARAEGSFHHGAAGFFGVDLESDCAVFMRIFKAFWLERRMDTALVHHSRAGGNDDVKVAT
jgi:hypothetical protein